MVGGAGEASGNERRPFQAGRWKISSAAAGLWSQAGTVRPIFPGYRSKTAPWQLAIAAKLDDQRPRKQWAQERDEPRGIERESQSRGAHARRIEFRKP